MQEVLAWYVSDPGSETRQALCFPPPPVTFGGLVWVLAQTAGSKGTVLSCWYLLQGTNLFKQRVNVTG